MAITHSFVSGKGDDPDATLVDGTAWDAAHTIASDTVTEAQLSTADNTTKNASASKHGFLAKVTGSSSDYVGGDNACHALPSGDAFWFNVKDVTYGATGDGVTNDYTAINSACAAASAAGGGTVYFPKGTYLMNTRLVVPANVNLLGEGIAASWLKGAVTVGNYQVHQFLKIGKDSYSTYIDDATDVIFHDVQFHGGGGTPVPRSTTAPSSA